MATRGEVHIVELTQAFLWTCEDCGRDNFERAVVLSPEALDLNNLPDFVDAEMIRDWTEAGGEGMLTLAPERVKCCHCSADFDAAEI